jgi:membrane dipeptidase
LSDFIDPDSPALEDARAALRRNPVVDLHVDSILQQRLFNYDVGRRHNARRQGQPLFWHADVPRMTDAGYASAAMGIHYWPFERPGAIIEAGKQIDYLDSLCKEQGINRAFGTAEWARSLRAESPALTLIPGVEGAHILGGELDNIDVLAARGIAYLTLSHFSLNKAATPAMGRGANQRDGLTAFGASVVERLNHHGIIVDVSHVNHPGVMDACAASRLPVLATHSGAQTVNAHARLLRDEAIDAIAEGGGAIGVIFSPGFLAGRRVATSEVVADHMDYIRARVGAEHVAIGSDYDGWLPSIPSDMKDCRDIVKVVALLQKRGWTEDELAGALRLNVARVAAAQTAVAAG